MSRRLAPVLFLVLALAGCTQPQGGDTGDFSGEEARVADVVGELTSSATRGEGAAVCDEIISERLQEEIVGDPADETSCVNEVEKAFDDTDGYILDVDEVTVDGEDATAEVSSEQVPERVTRTFSFVLEDDEWRIDSFG